MDNRRIQFDARFPNHNQSIETQQGLLDMMKRIINFELDNDAGVPMDIILANSNVGFVEGNDWLDSINGTKTPNGIIRVLHRDNMGGSFGAYNDAFLKFRADYEYWLFTEDDIMVGGRDYYRRILEKMRARKNVGFVALIGMIRHPLGTHAHGGVGLTSREILDNIAHNNNGELPYHHGDWNKINVIAEGEVKFTNFIEQKIGKEILVFHDEDEWNLETKLCIPYYNNPTAH
jgi:hypothetical protein